jgi:aryl sulfotransferase
MNSPTAAERLAHDLGLIREIRNASTMGRRLTVAGFDDLRDDTLLIFAAAALFHRDSADLARMLDIDEQTITQTIDALVEKGHLEVKPHPMHPDRIITAASKRSFKALREITGAVRAQRWTDFPFRQGDIVISTLPKSGTTWMQMICALLIFQTPDLPAPLQELSPHLDSANFTGDEVVGRLTAQKHQRFMKTHLSLDEIPVDSRATYIVIARDPLDMLLSHYRQRFVMPVSRLEKEVKASLPQAPSPHDWLLECIDRDNDHQDAVRGIMGHLSSAWARRNQPNVVLVHYEDLSADLEGQMRQFATYLDIAVPENAWPALAKAASFEQMRSAADRIQPLEVLKDPEVFFHSGTSGNGRALLSDDELAHYYDQAGKFAPADMLAWLHRH